MTTQTTFAVHANGTFWGAFAAADECAAMQAAADEHGTDGNTEGMTAQPLGDYVIEIADGCKSNGVDIRDLICEKFNCAHATIGDKGEIGIDGPQGHRWLDDESVADFLAWEAMQQ